MEDYKAQLGEYSMGKILGDGGSGKVRIAKKGGIDYALKYFVKTGEPDQKELRLGLMRAEAKIMAQLDHPNIVKLCDWGEDGIIRKKGKETPAIYLVVELAKGGELYEYVNVSGRFPETIARHFFRVLTDTVQYLHGKGVAHLDLKAENIFLDDNFVLKLGDFGYSSPLLNKDGVDRHYTFKGTESYQAPEFYDSVPYSAERADVFALGVLLFLMVVGMLPFMQANLANKRYELFVKDNKKFWEMILARKLLLKLSPDFIAFVNELMALNPQQRPLLSEFNKFAWFLGPVATAEEVQFHMRKRQQKVETKSEKTIAEKRAKKLAEKIAKTATIVIHTTEKGLPQASPTAIIPRHLLPYNVSSLVLSAVAHLRIDPAI